MSFPSTQLFNPSAPHPHVRVVRDFAELTSTAFGGEVNALCWPRTLAGDFGEVVAALGAGEALVTLDEKRLRSLRLSEQGRVAAEALMADLELLRDHGLDPVLNCIHGYPADEPDAPVRTDVFSFHADSAPVQADTWLCTYHGSPSEAVANADAVRRIDDAKTRATLLRLYVETEGTRERGPAIEASAEPVGFAEWLHEQCYDLHYALAPMARPFSFGHFNLWRIAVEYPGSPVPPCIHRAPDTVAGEPRLLLIS